MVWPDKFRQYLRWILLAWSVGLALLCLLIFLEGTGIISSGFERANRTFFGVTLPFRKATGVEMSDGKLGTMIVPLLWLLLLNSFQRYRIVPLPFRRWQIVLVGLAILIAQSRSTWLGVAVSGALLLLLLPGVRYKKMLYLIGLPFLLLVFLDGVDVTDDAFEADDMAGYVDCYLRGDDGKWIIDKDTNSFVFSRRYGNVLIEWK